MTAEQKNNALATIFTTQGLQAFNKMTASSDATVQKFWKGIQDSSGSAAQQAATQLDNLQGDITLLSSATEGLQLAFYNTFSGTIRGAIKGITSEVSGLAEAMESGGISGALSKLAQDAINFRGQLPGLTKIGGDLINGLISSVTQNSGSITTAVGQLLNNLASTISTGLNVFTSVGVNLLTTIASGMTQGIPTFLGQALPMLTQFTESLRSNAGKLINAGLALIQNIAQGLINSIPVLIAYVPTIITNLAGIINDNAPKIIATGVTIITNLAIGLVRAIPLLIANLPKIITAIVSVFTAFNWFSLGKNIFTGIIKGVKNLPSLLKTAAKNAVNGFKGAFRGNGILSAVKGAFTKIPSAVKSIFTKAVSLVKSFPGRFKSALKFSWSLPHLNLPHLSVSGGKAPFGIGGKGSLPSFHISWYKKAMESPYVFSDATLFGAGEAGDEMLYGRSRLMNDIKEATQGTKNDVSVTINVTVNGADNPEEWGRRMASELRRQVKMA